MSVRVKKYLNNTGTGAQALVAQTEYKDVSFENAETTVNGYTFHWGPNETRNFLDDGVGLAHAGFQAADATEDNVIQDIQSFNDSRS